ncbi:hypothetical protein Ais01nite_02870 [Asanoa ishikariensis]|uniref:Uncharacterized protein n=1 Tax=Asanoa ishikariensis TaxID=137265 RepID=A0A1H3TK98_9ACTN|nr:hypothetical protein [Asanoa ishikariensis]GIF62252.1 hypothetical protein Ais01nite_02870 [Asanoa ishikariensis]SDZ50674.1 hypothetical protein SAMN05421684_5945 [Asanoa ishikariensis]
MSATTEPEGLEPRTTLFDHALRLHRDNPDGVLTRDGEPYPDDALHSGRRLKGHSDRRLDGADVTAVLDEHFARTDAPPSELADAFHDLYVPIHRNDHIAAAALRADRQRVRRTGRWLVRHATDRCSATVGLALLATDWTDEDIPLIQTIGLLSKQFGPLATEALSRRVSGTEALLWLAQRVAGWGRVYVVEQLCQRGVDGPAREWLLRHACDGDFLNGYFAGQLATAAHLHEAVLSSEADDDLWDHAGRLLKIMGDCGGVGMTLEHYPPAPIVLTAHATHLAAQAPTAARYTTAAFIAHHLADKAPHRSGCTAEERDHIVRRYLSVLDQPDWCDVVRADIDPSNDFYPWFADAVASPLHLRAFSD